MYDLLSVLRKDELNDIYVEGLLLEIDTDEIKLLNEIFDIIDINQKDQLETLKSKIISCSLLNEANNSTDEAKNKIKKLKYSDNTTTVKKHLAIKKGNDDSAAKKSELKLSNNIFLKYFKEFVIIFCFKKKKIHLTNLVKEIIMKWKKIVT